MYVSPRGEIWITNDRLYRIDSLGNLDKEIILEKEREDRIWAFCQDKTETWWIGLGEEKIYLYHERLFEKPQLFTQYNGFDALRNTQKWHFFEDSLGIWMGTQNGLFLLDRQKGVVARFAEDAGEMHFLPARIFHHIHRDEAGVFWLATGDAGLIKVHSKSLLDKDNPPNYLQLTRSQGMPSNELYACLEDEVDHLWISTANGLVQLDKKTLKINIYFEEDGITHNEFNRISYFKSPSGIMYFGGINGVNRFDPKDFYNKKPYDPPLKISKVFKMTGRRSAEMNCN